MKLITPTRERHAKEWLERMGYAIDGLTVTNPETGKSHTFRSLCNARVTLLGKAHGR